MIIGSLGSVGMGLVWGWLLVLVRGFQPTQSPFRNFIPLVLATAFFAQQLYMFSGGQALLLFLGAATISLAVHLTWRRSLKAM